MASTIDQLVEQIRSLQSGLGAELAIRRANLNYTLRSGGFASRKCCGRIRRCRSTARYVFNAVVRIVTAPVIYSLIIPL